MTFREWVETGWFWIPFGAIVLAGLYIWWYER